VTENPKPNLVAKSLNALSKAILRKDGPYTRELLQAPSAFGLGRLPSGVRPDVTTTMVCGYCSTGCGLNVHLKSEQPEQTKNQPTAAGPKYVPVGITPTTKYPVNLGMACPKGWEALAALETPFRATSPLLRKNGSLTPVSWEEAIGEMVHRFKELQQKYGNDAVAWLGTGQIPVEELAFLGSLAKFGMGIIHGDGNTRQCMATAAVAYKQAFGFDAPPFTYKDFEESDVIVLVGSNLCIAHPIMWERICKNQRSPAIVVVDPRKTETAVAATHHYAPNPKSDQSLFYAVANWLIINGKIDLDYIARSVDGYESFKEAVAPFTLERAALDTGLPVEQVLELAQLIGSGKRVSFWWTMGVNQSHQGVRTAQALINLALITGNIGKPGTGANSITGQCNAMGSRVFSNTTGLLGGRDFKDPQHRREVAELLEIEEDRIPAVHSWAYDQIIEGILNGKIKALWVIATNPVHSWINQNHLKEVLSRLECLVVQDMYTDTETAAVADILLPAAGWGEKEGTFINSERRIGVIKKVAVSPGQALADFHIFQLIAEAWGCGDMFRKWETPEAVFQILKRLSVGRPCDFSGIEDYAHVDRLGGIQWPLESNAPDPEPERRLFEDGRFFTESGKATLYFSAPSRMPELPSKKFPLMLLTGRGSSSQWHTLTRTKRSAVLRKLSPEELYIEVNPKDARVLEIKPNDMVRVSSQRGEVSARAFVTSGVKPGHVFLAMHDASVNRLTFPVFDPYSRQPGYKGCAIRLERLS
jgi:assimilatory nitrate reductase catalytic subunit